MKEPTRWLDDPQTDARLLEVLKAAPQAPAPSEQAHAQMMYFASSLATQAVATKVAVGSSALKSLSAFFGFHGAAKAIAVVAMMGVLGTSSYVGVRYYVTHSAVLEAPGSKRFAVQAAPVPAVNAKVAPTTPEFAPEAQAAAAWEPPRVEASVSAAPTVGARSTPQPSAVSNQGQSGAGSFDDLSIADEARLLEKARALLSTDPAQALEVANTHQRLYPTGQLSAEREFIAVDALMRLGRHAEAEHRAEPRLQQFPNSLYARRLRKLLNP